MFFIGISGSVGVGKTTFTNNLKSDLETKGLKVEVVSLDNFLYSNNELKNKNLLKYKGFPQTYNFSLIKTIINKIKNNQPATMPFYSHEIYDIVPKKTIKINSVADVYLFEGIVALNSELNKEFNMSIFLKADIKTIKSWYINKVLEFKRAANKPEDSFYKQYEHLSDKKFKTEAFKVWKNINELNYKKYILPSAKNATIIINKDESHNLYF